MTGPDRMDTCHRCRRRFRWNAPGARGVVQTWRRLADRDRRGWRCADRGACR